MFRLINILSLLIFSLFPSGDDSINNEINVKLASYSWGNPQEKVYIHTDKPFYVAGEDLWFKAYLMVGPYHIPDTLSSVLYVELIGSDKKVYDRRFIRIREGLGFGNFALPHDISPGKYILKAYTHYMKNYNPAFQFRKVIDILPPVQYDDQQITGTPAVQNDTAINARDIPVHLRFFPEGGDMIENLQNYIAFKATGDRGKGIDIEGTVKNSDGREITAFKSQKFGLGRFTFNPAPEQNYFADIVYNGQSYQFPLPAPEKRGYVMHINQVGENLFIWVRNNMGLDMNNSFVIGQFRGFPFITINAKPGQKYLYSVINTREVPSGIIHFTFFDSLGIPHCERLVYTENKDERIEFTIDSNKKRYKKRENADFFINCTDLDGNPILTNMSLSITNTAVVNPDDTKGNIKSYFNLESDLRGTIENPGYYFNPGNKDRHELLDMLLLTHGWRRFTWKKILEYEPVPRKYPAELGFTIEGRLFNFYEQNQNQAGNVRLFIFENQFYYNEAESDEDGSFRFKGINIIDSTHVVIQAWRSIDEERKRKRKKPPETRNDYAIKINSRSFEEIIPLYWPEKFEQPLSVPAYLEHNEFILKIDSSYDNRTILMDELLIEDKKIKQDPFDRPGKLYKEASSRVVIDSLSGSDQSLLLFDIIRKYIPGINFRGTPPGVQISIRGATSMSGNNEPLILFDGTPVESDFIYYFPASEIAFFDVLKSGKAAMYGGRGANGVIAFYSRTEPRPYPEEGRRGMLNFIHPGYYPEREFYAPDYDIPDEKHAKTDYRRTLYWNPTLTTNDSGDINFSFYTSDETAEYRVQIEGMTYSGIPFVEDYYFTVE